MFDIKHYACSGQSITDDVDTLDVPRICGKQTQRNNVPARSPKEYFKLAVFTPHLDCHSAIRSSIF